MFRRVKYTVSILNSINESTTLVQRGNISSHDNRTYSVSLVIIDNTCCCLRHVYLSLVNHLSEILVSSFLWQMIINVFIFKIPYAFGWLSVFSFITPMLFQ